VAAGARGVVRGCGRRLDRRWGRDCGGGTGRIAAWRSGTRALAFGWVAVGVGLVGLVRRRATLTTRKIAIGCTLSATVHLEPLLDHISAVVQDLNHC
jgi:hypothetical protein